jgi:hypothetical protein
MPGGHPTVTCLDQKQQPEQQQQQTQILNRSKSETGETPEQQTSAVVWHSAGKDNSTAIPDTAKQAVQSPGVIHLDSMQQVNVLLFALTVLEAWISGKADVSDNCNKQQQQQQSPVVMDAWTMAAGSGDAMAATREIAAAVFASLQQLTARGKHVGVLADDDVAQQYLLVLRALERGRQRVMMQQQCHQLTFVALQHQVQLLPSLQLACLQLLILTPGVGLRTCCEAVVMLPDVLFSMVVECDKGGGGEVTGGRARAAPTATAAVTAAWHAVLQLLEAAMNSDDAVVRAAAVSSAGRLATGLWHGKFGQLALGSSSTTALKGLPIACFKCLVQLLVDRSSDLDVQVAAAARQSLGPLITPGYLLSATAGAGTADLAENYTAAADRMLLAATAASCRTQATAAYRLLSRRDLASNSGSSTDWVRIAALQQQQHAFKPVQLAQLFELMFQASPILLQHRLPDAARPSGVQGRHLLSRQWESLFRLARCLPALPAVGSAVPISGTGNRRILSFEELHTGAATGWLLLQEASRQCVNARMRTHMGTPAQSFTTLEKLIHGMLHKLQSDGSAVAAQRSWQQQLLGQLAAAIPQQQQQQQQQESEQLQQHEPQQLLQAPGLGGALPARIGATRAGPANTQQQQQPPVHQAVSSGPAQPQQPLAAPHQDREVGASDGEEQRLEAEQAAGCLLDFLWALEVNICSAADGSLLRPPVNRSTMAFYAGNKRVRLPARGIRHKWLPDTPCGCQAAAMHPEV